MFSEVRKAIHETPHPRTKPWTSASLDTKVRSDRSAKPEELQLHVQKCSPWAGKAKSWALTTHVHLCYGSQSCVNLDACRQNERAHSHLVQLHRHQLCSIQNNFKQYCVTRRSLTPTQQTLLVLQLKPQLPLSSVMQNLVRSKGLLKSPQYSNSAVFTDTSKTPSILHYWQHRKGMVFPCK